MRWILAVLSIGLFAVVTYGLLGLPQLPTGLTSDVLASLADAGTTHAVTAVLLNFRGYDTLLEIAVLLLALVGVWSLGPAVTPRIDLAQIPMLRALLGWFVPAVLVSSGYLLYVGASAPGGAFQGGALLGGGLIMLTLGGLGYAQHLGLLRAAIAVGLVVFVGIALGSIWLGGGILAYPAPHAGALILVIETAAFVSIGLKLGLLFLGGRIEPDLGANAPAGASSGHASEGISGSGGASGSSAEPASDASSTLASGPASEPTSAPTSDATSKPPAAPTADAISKPASAPNSNATSHTTLRPASGPASESALGAQMGVSAALARTLVNVFWSGGMHARVSARRELR